MEVGGPDQEVEGLVGLVGQEDLRVDVGEFVQLKLKIKKKNNKKHKKTNKIE